MRLGESLQNPMLVGALLQSMLHCRTVFPRLSYFLFKNELCLYVENSNSQEVSFPVSSPHITVPVMYVDLS